MISLLAGEQQKWSVRPEVTVTATERDALSRQGTTDETLETVCTHACFAQNSTQMPVILSICEAEFRGSRRGSSRSLGTTAMRGFVEK